MAFITIDELRLRKFKNTTSDLSEDESLIVEELTNMAVSEVKTYLAGRYDTDYIFEQTGFDRHPVVKRIVLDFVLTMLFERTNSNEIPDSITNRNTANLKWLSDVSKGIIFLTDLPAKGATSTTSTLLKFGSNKKFNS